MQSPPVPARSAALISHRGIWLLLAAAVGVPISLLWDFSWESTVGIDLFWSPPHVLTHAAMALAVVGAAMLISSAPFQAQSHAPAIQLGRLKAPFGAWLALWGTIAFVTALLFDRWWQSAYGLEAGIWHPPQILKATAFFVTLFGVWFIAASAQNQSADGSSMLAGILFAIAGGLLLVLITIVTLTSSYPNHQHSAVFYQVACATYPIILVALTRAGRLKWSATGSAAVYMVVIAAAVWLLPLVSARTLTGPIYNPMEHLMPPPFPLLLVVPALAMDWLIKKFRWPAIRGISWLQSLALGFTFFVVFLCVQWVFSEFLLMPLSDNWFFAGGGKHWPFFLKISPSARLDFWNSPGDEMNWRNAILALGLAIIAARLGLWLGAWMTRVRR